MSTAEGRTVIRPDREESHMLIASASASELASALRQVARAASKDTLRPSLTGVQLTSHGGGLRLAATDMYRLAVRDVKGVSMLPDGQSVIVAAKGLGKVRRLASHGEVEVVRRDREVVFRTSRAEVTVPLIEGDFPKYDRLIPNDYPNRLVVARDALLEALDRLPMGDDAPVRVAMSASGLELSMTAQDGGNAHESLDAKYEGNDLTVAFNIGFLRDGVDAIEGSEVVLETDSPLRAATLRAADRDDFLYVLMPVRTRYRR